MNDSDSAQPETKPNRSRGAVRWLIRSGMWLLLAGFAFSYFGQLSFFAELLTNFRTQFCLLFLIALLLARPVKASWLLFGCLLVAIGFSGWDVGKFYLPGEQPVPGDTTIRVMSFNVLANNEEFDVAIAEIEEHDPDVVAVLEYADMWHFVLDALNEKYPHQHRDPRWHGYGIAIFSKFPLEEAKSIPLTEKVIDNPAASVKVRVGDQLIRFIAVHVMSPIRPYRLELRNRQFEEIAGHVNSESEPTILVGDMNCTTSSSYLSGLIETANLRDTRQGFGLHPSWPSIAGVFAVPIDHILVSETIHVHKRYLGDAAGSDHCPVIVDVSVSSNR